MRNTQSGMRKIGRAARALGLALLFFCGSAVMVEASNSPGAEQRRAVWLEARRELARRCHLDFMKYTWRTPASPLIEGRHTREVAERLDRAEADLARSKSSYLIVTLPPRHGKSDLVSRYWPPKVLGRNPDLEIILTTYGAVLSEEMSRDARGVLSSAEFRELFPDVRLDPEKSAVGFWAIDGRRGKLRAAGLDGGITGKGADVLIVDDYQKNRKEAESPTIRQGNWDSFTNDLMTRLAPAHIVVILATRWHVNDLIGRILEMMKTNPEFPHFEVMHFPARTETTRPDGTRQTRWLFPERFSEEYYLRTFATLGAYAAAALMQGEPTLRGGNMLKVENIQIVDEMPAGLLWVRMWDLASTEKERDLDDPDWTVGAKIAAKVVNGAEWLFIDDMRWCQAEALTRNKLIRDTALADGPGVWQAIEDVGGYKDCVTTMKNILKGKSIVHEVTNRPDKVVCAGEVEPIYSEGHVVMRRGWWNQEAIQEMADFPNGVHDDKVDAVTKGWPLALERWNKAGKFGAPAMRRGMV